MSTLAGLVMMSDAIPRRGCAASAVRVQVHRRKRYRRGATTGEHNVYGYHGDVIAVFVRGLLAPVARCALGVARIEILRLLLCRAT